MMSRENAGNRQGESGQRHDADRLRRIKKAIADRVLTRLMAHLAEMDQTGEFARALRKLQVSIDTMARQSVNGHEKPVQAPAKNGKTVELVCPDKQWKRLQALPGPTLQFFVERQANGKFKVKMITEGQVDNRDLDKIGRTKTGKHTTRLSKNGQEEATDTSEQKGPRK
jgi:hypothetical protein